MYWKANKKFAESQRLKKENCLQNDSGKSTEVSQNSVIIILIIKWDDIFDQFCLIVLKVLCFQISKQVKGRSNKPQLQCYSSCCRKETNYKCYAVQCTMRKNVSENEVCKNF